MSAADLIARMRRRAAFSTEPHSERVSILRTELLALIDLAAPPATPAHEQTERKALANDLREAFDRKWQDADLHNADTWLFAADVVLARHPRPATVSDSGNESAQKSDVVLDVDFAAQSAPAPRPEREEASSDSEAVDLMGALQDSVERARQRRRDRAAALDDSGDGEVAK